MTHDLLQFATLLMDLSVEILQLVVEYLPKCAQYALIGDTPVGRHSCNRFYKFIGFSSSKLQPHQSYLQRLNTIDINGRTRRGHRSPMFVKSYKALKAQYPFYQPGEIYFDSVKELCEFYLNYGDEIHKFQAIEISCSFKDRYTVDEIPTLNNVRWFSIMDPACPVLQLLEKFGGIKWFLPYDSDIDVVKYLPDIEHLDVGALEDYSKLNLQTLICGGEFKRDFLPSTLKHLQFNFPMGNLDFSGLFLTSLDVTYPPSSIFKDLSNSCVPQTLRELTVQSRSSSDHTQDVLPGPSTVFPNLHLLRLFYVPVEVWNYMITPNIRKLYFIGVNGRLKSIDGRNLEELKLWSVTLHEDFQLPRSLIYLDLSQLRRYRTKDTNETVPVEDNSLVPPESLVCLRLNGTIPSYCFGKSLLKVVLRPENVGELTNLFGSLPSNILEVSLWGKWRLMEDQQAAESILDLSRFHKMVKLALGNANIPQNRLILPPNLAELNFQCNVISYIPMLPQLERLEITFQNVSMRSLELPPRLRWLTVHGDFTVENEIDFSFSVLETIQFMGNIRLKKLTLPKTMKTLSFDFDCGFQIDSSLCDQFFRIDDSRSSA